jgi:hypothetical protein
MGKPKGWVNPAYFHRCERCFRRENEILNLLGRLARSRDKKLADRAKRLIRQIQELEL